MVVLLAGCGQGLTTRTVSVSGLSAEEEAIVHEALQLMAGVQLPSRIVVVGGGEHAGQACVDCDPCLITLGEYDDGIFPIRERLIPIVWHEVGHCLGQEHILDAGDVMHPQAPVLRAVTPAKQSAFFARLR